MTSSSAGLKGAGPSIPGAAFSLPAPAPASHAAAIANPSVPQQSPALTSLPTTESSPGANTATATVASTMPTTTTATTTAPIAAAGANPAADRQLNDATSIATTTPTTDTELHAVAPHNHAPSAAPGPSSTTQHAASFPASADGSLPVPSGPLEPSLPLSSELDPQNQDNRPATPRNQTDVTMLDVSQAPSVSDPLPKPSAHAAPDAGLTTNTQAANSSAMDIDQAKTADGQTTTASQANVPNNVSQPDPTLPWTPNPTANLPPSTPTNVYKEHRNSYSETFNHHAALMMALATMHTDRTMAPPQQLEQTVTPSQVTLPPPVAANPLEESNSVPFQDRLNESERHLESFARIEFADSVFQMTTYEVVIGRDQRALTQARRDEKRANEYRHKAENNARLGLSPPPPITHDRSKFSKSYVSEEGGMLGPESDNEGDPRPAKRRKTSTGGSSNENEESQENIISNRQYVSHTPGAAAVDLASLRPSPHHVPFIGIHSPGPDIASKTKAISREHLKIMYNQTDGVFEALPLHKNGFFCDDIHYSTDKVILKCGDRLQIKDVDFRFIINGVERGRTGAEDFADEKPTVKKHSGGGKEMSFDFEQAQDNVQMQDTSDELSDVEVSPPELSDGDEAEEEEEETGEAAVGDETMEPEEVITPEVAPTQALPTTESDMLLPQIPKKRGPGRPPKNGIMSKREQRLLKKQQQELAKKTIPQMPVIEPPIKRKVGRPRKHPLPDDGVGDRPEKRKYKPRKPKNEDGGEGSDPERPIKEKKEKKVRPKSPPLELKIEDYTPEELQKPNKNYGVLIDETLTAAPDGLTLKQIYKRICQRYPWFYFHTETKGWESSVRHNLIGNDAFRKDDTTNVWLRVPGVELDAGKKRKATSPDRNIAAQNYGAYSYPYTAAHHMVPGAPGYNPAQAAPGFQIPNYSAQQQQQLQQQQQQQQQQQAGQVQRQPQQLASGTLGSGQPGLVAGPQQPAPAQVSGYGPQTSAAARPPAGVAQQPGAYNSPYASRPQPANHPIKTEDGGSAPAQPIGQQSSLPKISPVQGQRLSATPGVSPALPQLPPQGQQQPVPPLSNRPSAPSVSASPPKPIIDPRLLNAVVNLKNGLIENLRRARNPHAETVVYSAINRCAGLKTDTTENDNVERICIKGIRQVVDGFLSKHRSPTPGGSSAQGTPEAAGMLDPHALKTLLGFKNVSCSTLQTSLGAAQAEAVTLSAIDRVLGLADVSLVRDNERLSSLETSLMQTTRQLLSTLEKSRAQGTTQAAK